MEAVGVQHQGQIGPVVHNEGDLPLPAQVPQSLAQGDGFPEGEGGTLFPELKKGDPSVDGLLQHLDRIAAAAILTSHHQVEGIAEGRLHDGIPSRRWAQ